MHFLGDKIIIIVIIIKNITARFLWMSCHVFDLLESEVKGNLHFTMQHY